MKVSGFWGFWRCGTSFLARAIDVLCCKGRACRAHASPRSGSNSNSNNYNNSNNSGKSKTEGLVSSQMSFRRAEVNEAFN